MEFESFLRLFVVVFFFCCFYSLQWRLKLVIYDGNDVVYIIYGLLKSSFHFLFFIFRLLFTVQNTIRICVCYSIRAVFIFKRKNNHLCWLKHKRRSHVWFSIPQFIHNNIFLFVENFPSPFHSSFSWLIDRCHRLFVLLRMNWLRSPIKIIFNYALKLPSKFAIVCVQVREKEIVYVVCA